jgi:hypothetical protein
MGKRKFHGPTAHQITEARRLAEQAQSIADEVQRLSAEAPPLSAEAVKKLRETGLDRVLRKRRER